MTLDEISKGIIEALDNALAGDKAVEALSSKIIDGKGTYADAERLASKTGLRTGKAISDGLIQNAVGGMVTEDVARAAIVEPLKYNHGIVSEACRFVQEALNRKAGLGLKAIQPKFNQDRADGLVTEAVGREDMSDFAKALTQQVENFSMAAVDDSVRENADAHYEAGLYPKIRRITDGKCCEWCRSLAGTYEYGEVRNTGNDVFRRHPNCGCQVLYDPSDGSRWQDVHSKRDLSAEESNVDRVMARIRAGREAKRGTRLMMGEPGKNEWTVVQDRDILEVRKAYGLVEEQKSPEQRVAEAERLINEIKGKAQTGRRRLDFSEDVVRKKSVFRRSRTINTDVDLREVSSSSVIKLKSKEEIAAYFFDTYGIVLEGFDGKDLLSIQAPLAGYDDMLNMFPELVGKIKKIQFDPTIDFPGETHVVSGISLLGNKGLRDYGTGVHEATHMLDVIRSGSFLSSSYAERIFEQAKKNLKLRRGTKKYDNLVFKMVGPSQRKKDYTEPAELIAYGMETAMGGVDNVLAKEILRLIQGGF